MTPFYRPRKAPTAFFAGSFVPAVVGANVVVCLRSGLVGLAVAGGTLGFRTGSLSVCFKLFTLSGSGEKPFYLRGGGGEKPSAF